ncbi:MAG: hypothetical protein ACRD3W_04230, partial [Terriglobales bacterium]
MWFTQLYLSVPHTEALDVRTALGGELFDGGVQRLQAASGLANAASSSCSAPVEYASIASLLGFASALI